jgi:2-C-methyl-D-erythritol 2,4-cyclodiphosphate synthase
LILGGVTLDFEKGLDGHSDADVLVHALMDALLGAVAAGDLGKHFPPTDPQYRGASSLALLQKVQALLESRNYLVENVDAIVVAEKPQMAPYIEQMRANLARTLKIDYDRVSIKATTTEGLGFTGQGQGIAAYAVASVYTLAEKDR